MQTCTYRWCQIKQPQPLEEFVTLNGKQTKFCRSCRERRKQYEINAERRAGYVRKPFGGTARTPLEQLRPNTWYAQQRRREEYAYLLVEQEYKCAICYNDISAKGAAYMDHCHSTGKARGWLCQGCNSGLGFFKNSPELLAKAIEYVKR